MLSVLFSLLFGTIAGASLVAAYFIIKMKKVEPGKPIFEMPTLPTQKKGLVIRDMDKRTYEFEQRDN